jgi:hypothetical protein
LGLALPPADQRFWLAGSGIPLVRAVRRGEPKNSRLPIFRSSCKKIWGLTAPLLGFLFEVLEVDEDGGGQDEGAFVEAELVRLEDHAEAIGVREGLAQHA